MEHQLRRRLHEGQRVQTVSDAVQDAADDVHGGAGETERGDAVEALSHPGHVPRRTHQQQLVQLRQSARGVRTAVAAQDDLLQPQLQLQLHHLVVQAEEDFVQQVVHVKRAAGHF